MNTSFMGAKSHEIMQTFYNRELDLFAVIAIHTSASEPAIGGCRCLQYSNYDLAIQDALLLSSAMSKKAQFHQLNNGGAKMVVALPKKYNRMLIMQQIGAWVDQLQGSYIAASDSGSDSNDMNAIYTKTQYVACPDKWSDYNPSLYTALGVYSVISKILGNLAGKKIFIQGVGEVGMHLSSMLVENKACVTVTDTSAAKMAKAKQLFGVKTVAPDAIGQECDVFVPCALGGILNPITLPKLRTKLVIGAANNQFLDPVADSKLAQSLGISVVPDYIANGGGLIHVSGLNNNYSKQQIIQAVNAIGQHALAQMEHA